METLSNLREFYGTKVKVWLTSNVEYISTDLSMRYLGLLLYDLNENGGNYILTDSITVPDNSDKSISKAIDLLMKLYLTLMGSIQ